MLKYNQVVEFFDKFRLNLNEKKMAITDLIKLIFLVIYVGHLCGCAFHYVAQLELSYSIEHTWLEEN